MRVMLREAAFSPYQELENYQRQAQGGAGKYGATVVFVGTMRDVNLGDEVTGMALEHYPGMTERRLEIIVHEARTRWDLLDALLIHRVGDISPNESIVLIAVWTSHRGAAFEACRFIIEELKHTAPFWKKERLENGERWVEINTAG